jgi:hypothetical protein
VTPFESRPTATSAKILRSRSPPAVGVTGAGAQGRFLGAGGRWYGGHRMRGIGRLLEAAVVLAASLAVACGGSGNSAEPGPEGSESPAATDRISVARRAMAAHPWRLKSAVHFNSSLKQEPAPGSADCSAQHDLQVGAVWSFRQGAQQEDSVSVQSPCDAAPIAQFLTILADDGDAHLYVDAQSAYSYMSVCWATTDQMAPLPSSRIRGCSFGIAPNDQLVLDHYTLGLTSVTRYSFSP